MNQSRLIQYLAASIVIIFLFYVGINTTSDTNHPQKFIKVIATELNMPAE